MQTQCIGEYVWPCLANEFKMPGELDLGFLSSLFANPVAAEGHLLLQSDRDAAWLRVTCGWLIWPSLLHNRLIHVLSTDVFS